MKIYLEASNRDEVTVQDASLPSKCHAEEKLESPFTQSSRLFAAEAIRYDVFHFVSKMPPWPSRLVSASQNTKLVDFERDGQTFYKFTGKRLGGNAAIIEIKFP